MAEMLALLTFFVGIPLLIIGWIWSCVIAKRINNRWFIGMLLPPTFFFTLPFITILHWQKIKWPFVLTSIAMVILIVTWLAVPA